MADMEDNVDIRCSNCDALIATVPKSRPLNDDGLICSNCGAEVRTSSPLEKMAEKAARAIEKAEDALEKTLSGRSDTRK
jgi:hypothetical protein